MKRNLRGFAAAGFLLLAMLAVEPASAQKQGGVLKIYFFDSPASVSIHEETTAAGQGPVMGVFNNLVMYKQDVPQSGLQSICYGPRQRIRDYGRRLIWAWLDTLTSRSLCSTVKAAVMFVKMALEIWKCRFSWPLRIFSIAIGNDFQQGPRKSRNAPFSNVQHFHPLRGTAAAKRGRPAQALGAVGCGRVGTT